MWKGFFLLTMIFFFYSCKPGNESTKPQTNRFFSLADYFDNQARFLNKKKTKLHKVILKSGEKEERMLKDLEWEKELKLFSDADINKNAWINLYTIDSTFSDSSFIVSYQAIDSSLQIKNIKIHTLKGQISEINIESRFKNFYYQSFMQLSYKPSTGYHIKGEQAIHFISSHYFDITGTFNE